MSNTMTRRPFLHIADAPADKLHHCAVDGCDQLTLTGFVACRAHWLQLPRPVRHTLGEAFRCRTTRPDLFDEAVAIARRLVNEAARGAA